MVKWYHKRGWFWLCDWCNDKSVASYKTEQDAKTEYQIHLAKKHNAN